MAKKSTDIKQNLPIKIALVVFLTCAKTFCQSGPITFTQFYDTQAIRFTIPIWFGELPTEKGTFVVGELGGNLTVLRLTAGIYQATPYGHIPVAECCGNDGLLGMAFHPDFKNNHKYYVYYNPVAGEGVLEERFADSSFSSDAGFSREILRIVFPKTLVHNGGDMHFGADGFLYLGLGDAGNPNTYNSNAQNLHLLFGKMLRLDVDRKSVNREYAIPADNPFVGDPDTLVRQEIYAYGLRQPWRWSFDPLDGRLWVADVGDWVQEEIDTVTKGGNYGWSIQEGNTCFDGNNEFLPLASCDTTGLVPPLATIGHIPISSAATLSIIGGYVFRGNTASSFYGTYFFSDWVTQKIYTFKPMSVGQGVVTEVGTAPTQPSAFGTDSDGNLYFVGVGTGVVYRLTHPDLQTAIHSKPGRSKSKVFSRRNGKWQINLESFPNLEHLRILGLDGKLRLSVSRNELADGFGADLSPGIYVLEGRKNGTRETVNILMH